MFSSTELLAAAKADPAAFQAGMLPILEEYGNDPTAAGLARGVARALKEAPKAFIDVILPLLLNMLTGILGKIDWAALLQKLLDRFLPKNEPIVVR